MNNFIRCGKTMEVTAPNGGLTSGQVYQVEDVVGVVVDDTAEGETAVMNLEGVYTCEKATVAFSQGEKIYWDDSAKKMTTTSASNTLVGVADETVASGVTEADVRWNGSF